METRKLKISKETANRWYNGSDTELKQLALQTFPELGEKELPKSWDELGEIDGWYVDTYSEVIDMNSVKTKRQYDCTNLFATKKQAEASIALAQLSQLMKVYNNGWVADWKSNKDKHVIYFNEDNLIKSINNYNSRFLSFKDEKTRDLFLENFRELIETAKPLL
jgi:hypothetical protein